MSARATLGITGACAVSFAGAFAVGSTTRDAAAPRPAPAAAVAAAPTRIAALAAADGLPGLRATRARHAAAHSPARAVVRRTPAVTRRPVRAVAPVTRPVSAPAPAAKPKPVPSRPVTTNRRPATSAPVSTARKPSVTFFDEGD
jgi:hypothetical protein